MLEIDRGRPTRQGHYKLEFHERRINSIYRPPVVCERDKASEMITTPVMISKSILTISSLKSSQFSSRRPKMLAAHENIRNSDKTWDCGSLMNKGVDMNN